MRDDARALVTGLVRDLRTKLDLVQKLLLSESDKHHYEKSGNLERVMDLTRDDAFIIDAVNLADYDIARAEDTLCGIIGVRRDLLYDSLGAEAEARELTELRESLLRDIRELHRLRRDLLLKLEADARGIKDSIAALSRIDALKGPETEGDDR
ncbi:MAG TPA: hypothetical protein PK307_02930 [Spirochaetota bacterium]|nr:hypothetical protein [Spirochaetota bacterium]HOD16576.1 hypothetical protein [Spirochaetota bacterium]HPN11375.1 hypothetical protein [Spirochaetota bacterium]HQL81128.1 hypothetical protein [Spirochaetota bacterium]